MQKEKTIRQLYYGNIQPFNKRIEDGSAYQQAQCRFSDVIDALHKTLDAEEKVLLEQLTDDWNAINSIGREDSFVDGFQLGGKIALELYEKDDEQLSQFMG